MSALPFIVALVGVLGVGAAFGYWQWRKRQEFNIKVRVLDNATAVLKDMAYRLGELGESTYACTFAVSHFASIDFAELSAKTDDR